MAYSGEVLVGISEKAVDSVEAEERLPVVALLPPELQERRAASPEGKRGAGARSRPARRSPQMREVVDDLAEPFAVGVFGIGLEVGAAGIKGLGALVGVGAADPAGFTRPVSSQYRANTVRSTMRLPLG